MFRITFTEEARSSFSDEFLGDLLVILKPISDWLKSGLGPEPEYLEAEHNGTVEEGRRTVGVTTWVLMVLHVTRYLEVEVCWTSECLTEPESSRFVLAWLRLVCLPIPCELPQLQQHPDNHHRHTLDRGDDAFTGSHHR